MQLNKTKSKIRRSLGGGGLNNFRAHWCSLVVQTDSTRSFPGKSNTKNLISRNEPNFKSKTYTLTHEITMIYSRIHRNHHPKNEPNTNPIRTQYEPNTNPIRTQFEPNTNPIRTQTNPKQTQSTELLDTSSPRV